MGIVETLGTFKDAAFGDPDHHYAQEELPRPLEPQNIERMPSPETLSSKASDEEPNLLESPQSAPPTQKMTNGKNH